MSDSDDYSSGYDTADDLGDYSSGNDGVDRFDDRASAIFEPEHFAPLSPLAPDLQEIPPDDLGVPENVNFDVMSERAGAGNWRQWAPSWDGQTDNQSCGPAVVSQIFEGFTGREYTDRQFMDYAYQRGWFQYNTRGVFEGNMPALFAAGGIQANTYHSATLGYVASELNKGNAVVAVLDMNEYNGKAYPQMGDGQRQAPHYVVVTQIDEATGDVYISDPWTPNTTAVGSNQWGQIKMPRAYFESAWEDAGGAGKNVVVVAQHP